jgi:hypothetical protein
MRKDESERPRTTVRIACLGDLMTVKAFRVRAQNKGRQLALAAFSEN